MAREATKAGGRAVTLPFTIVCDSSDRPVWLAARDSGVGASESSAVLGCSPWSSAIELWAVKTGRAPAKDLTDVEAVFWGNALESAIVSGYSQRTGRAVVNFGVMLRSTRWPWLTATPDAFTSERASAEDTDALLACIGEIRQGGSEVEALHAAIEKGGWFPLQIKNIGFGSAEHWSEGVPLYYRVQCTQEALVCGAARTSGAALIAGQRLAWDDVEVDLDGVLERQVVNLTRHFWSECVKADVQPTPDASESARRALAVLFPRAELGKQVVLGAAAMDRAYALEAAKERLLQAKRECDELENLIRADIGDAETAVYPDGSAHTLKQQTRKSCVVAESTFRVLRRKKAREQ
jgi:putative phage-type endonuclease